MKKQDLRIKRTNKLLISALLKTLKSKNFNQITVNDLCEEALVSRASFYVHFTDKYNLLEYWLVGFGKDIAKTVLNYKELESTVNEFINDNRKVIINILNEANNETSKIVYNFISSIVNASIEGRNKDPLDNNNIVLSQFCAGGILNMISRQMQNQYQDNDNLVTPYSYEMLKYIMDWLDK